MYKQFIVILIIVASLDNAFVECNRGGSRNKGYSEGSVYGRRAYYGGQSQAMAGESAQPSQTPKEYLDQKSGFSTFGIISIMFAIIVFCLAFYYAIMCYPLFFRDEQKYRYMSDISSTTTGVTSRSMQSIQHYPADQKH